MEATGRTHGFERMLAEKSGWRLPRFSINSFLSLLLHNFRASAFARNAYGLAPLMGEFSDSFLTVVAATVMLYGLRSTWLQQWFRVAIAALGRVDRSAFFARFNEGEAVPYFYEPFLEAFDPALHKQLGVWYTPTEVARYIVVLHGPSAHRRSWHLRRGRLHISGHCV